MFQFIQQQNEFENVLTLMTQCSTYGLDTEFIKVDTLWPKLGIFQININGKVFLLDGTTLDLTRFWQLLFNAKQNIFHACGEDLDLIYHYAHQQNLNNVFDTQVALSFLGHGLQVSYQNALKLMLNIDIDKDQTRSDWLARPLTPKQLEYAANDVLYIMQLADTIKSQLQAKHLLAYVEEDCQHLAHEIGNETPIPREVLLRKKWLNSLYKHVIFKADEQDLPSYLLGWRYEVLTKPLIRALYEDQDYLSQQMKETD